LSNTEIKHKVVPVYVMTAYGGGEIAPFILNLITSDGGGWSTSHSSHFIPWGKNSLHLPTRGLGGIHSRSGRPAEEKILLSLTRTYFVV